MLPTDFQNGILIGSITRHASVSMCDREKDGLK